MIRVLKFYADWCQPCKLLSKILEDVKTDVVIENYNIDDEANDWIVKHYNVRGIPLMVKLDENVEMKRKSGVMTKEELEEWLNG
jgi:thioredoxin 1